MSRRLTTLAAAASLFIALSAASQPKPCDVGFAAPMIHDRGLAPRVAVAEGDFDRDGRTDLVALHRFGDDGLAGRIGTILLNRGNDAFDPIPLVAGPGDFGTIHVADLNRDANLDVVAAGSFSALLLLGNGNGTFRKGPELPVRSVASVTSGDFNLDNRIDLAFAHINPGAFSVHLANADGTYREHSVTSLQGEGRAIAAADLDGDNRTDLVVADRLTATPYFSDGSGNFARSTALPVSAPPLSLAIADITNDRLPDIVVGGQSGITVLAGSGGRGFRLNGNYGLTSDVQSVVLADLDRDGNVDMVAAGTGDVVVFRGAGGFFTESAVYAGGANATWVTVAELTGDQLPDLAVANTASGDVAILRNLGNIRFDAMQKFFTGVDASVVMTADLNTDAFDDLVIYNDASLDVSVLYGREAGGFTLAAGSRLPFAAKQIRVGDFTADGALDVAALSVDGTSLAILTSTVSGGLTSPFIHPMPEAAAAFEIGEFNNDGRADIVVFDPDGEVDVYPALPGSGFGPTLQTLMIPGGVVVTTAADMNGDGFRDFVAIGNGFLTLLRGTSLGSLTVGASGFAPAGVQHLVAANLNGDVFLDLAVGSPSGVDVLIADPGGVFTPQAHASLAANSASGLTAADFDTDGDVDLAASSFDLSTSESFLTPLFNRGDGTLELGVSGTTESQPTTLAALDFDRDGFIDLATAAGKVIVSRGRCEVQRAAVFAAPNPAFVGQPITLVANALGGSVRNVTFTFRREDTVIGGANPLPHEPGVGRFNIGTLPQGTHRVTAIALYGDGSTTESDPITVVVGVPRRRSVRH